MTWSGRETEELRREGTRKCGVVGQIRGGGGGGGGRGGGEGLLAKCRKGAKYWVMG